MQDNSILKTEGIYKKFGGVIALEDLDFEVKYGEVHAVVGENGAGKSTLMNILSGSIKQDAGDIFLNDQKIDINSPYIAQKLGISMVHQELNLIPDLTVAENIFFGRQAKNIIVNWHELFTQAEEVLSKIGVNFKAEIKVKNLSISQMQQVEIAKALSQDCKLLILDEPTASLVSEEVEVLFNRINMLRNRNIAIIYISHRLEEIFKISDRITVLRDGHKIGTLNTSDTNQNNIVKTMLGPHKLISSEKKKEACIPGKEVLNVKNLCTAHKLKNITFNLCQGETIGIAGLMGSGRTELVQAIFGDLHITDGEITLQGKKHLPKTPEHAVKQGIALVPEDRKNQGLIMGMYVKDNLTFAGLKKLATFNFLNLNKEKKMAEDIVEKTNIKLNSIYQKVNSLSGGNQQKVVFGKWFFADSEILLLDEPTKGIDVGAKEEVFNMIDNLKSKGKSIIFISSELDEIITVSDRILVMYNGQIIKSLPRDTSKNTLTGYVSGGNVDAS